MDVCGCAGQLSGVNVWNCMNVKQGITKKEACTLSKKLPWINNKGSEAAVVTVDCVI